MRIESIRQMAHDILDHNAIENDYIEYKKSADQPIRGKILKTVCAYANNYMNREIGLLFVGVEEVDNKATGEKAIPLRPISGIKESMLETTENELKSLLANIHPKVNYHLIIDEIDCQKYIIVAVEPGSNGPYATSDKAEKDKKIGLKAGRYVRVKRDTRLPNAREEFELLKKFADFHFSSDLNECATIDDLNYEYMKEYLIATNAKQDIRSLSKLDMARSMGLISESEYGGYRARNFAVLMFADRPQDFIPYARVEVIREAVGTDKMVSQVFDGPVWIQVKRVIDYFKETIMSAYTVRETGLTGHRMVYNWPGDMFSELATNCILHKEYDKKQYIGIYVYSDHISFINHNRPLPPVTIEAMNTDTEFRERNYLNPELKEMFFSLNLIESYGSGIRRAKNAMAENHSPELVFSPKNDSDDYTMVTAYINEEFVKIQKEEQSAKIKKGSGVQNERRERGKMSEDLSEDLSEVFSEKELKKIIPILNYIAENEYVTPKTAMQLTGKSAATSRRYLKILCDAGILEKEGKTSNIQYRRL